MRDATLAGWAATIITVTSIAVAAAAWPSDARARPGAPREATLADLKTGSVFEMIEDVSTRVPEFFRLIQDQEFLVKEHSFEPMLGRGTNEPACLIRDFNLGPGERGHLRLPKGSKIKVTSASISRRRNPRFSGPGVLLTIQAEGGRASASLRCFAGKGARAAMPIEVFERLFRRKIRVLAPEGRG